MHHTEWALRPSALATRKLRKQGKTQMGRGISAVLDGKINVACFEKTTLKAKLNLFKHHAWSELKSKTIQAIS